MSLGDLRSYTIYIFTVGTQLFYHRYLCMTLHVWGEFNVHFSFDQRVGVHLRVRLSMSEVPRTIGPRAVAQTVIALFGGS